MKFYEFDTNNFAYYGLIGAKDEAEATVFYTSMVADIEETDGNPIEINSELALAKLLNVCKNENELKEAKEEFESYCYKNDEPYLVLIDRNLA